MSKKRTIPSKLRIAEIKKKDKAKELKKENKIAIWGLFFVLLITTITLLAIFFLKKPIEEISFDSRKAAMVNSGLVELDTYPFDQSSIKLGEKQEINLQINSKDQNLSYIELKFEILADSGLLSQDKIQFSKEIPAALEIKKAEIIEYNCSDKECFLATLILISKNSQSLYSTSNQMENISKLIFFPEKEGRLELKISQDSQVFVDNNNNDILATAQTLNFEYFVTENGIDPAQCFYNYSDWDSCENGWQSRNYSVEPDNCHWYQELELAELSRKCTVANASLIYTNDSSFFLSTEQSCWDESNNGTNLFINWDKNKYENISWIDLSESTNFENFYHKKVEGNIFKEEGQILAVTASNFLNAVDGSGPLIFEANKEYFFRAYNSDGYHLSALRFKQDRCLVSSENSSINGFLPSEYYELNTYACNHGCNNNRDCDANLRCYQGKCRAAANPEDSNCLLEEYFIENLIEEETATITAKINPKTSPTTAEKQFFVQEKEKINFQSIFFGIMSSFSWQWLAIVGLVIIISISLVIIAIAKSKKDPWSEIKSFEEEEKTKKTLTERKKVIIPENKALKIKSQIEDKIQQ